jgi:hypothetical protein
MPLSCQAVAKVTDDLDELLAFYDYPADALATRTSPKPRSIR